jgi:hypothetical protein
MGELLAEMPVEGAEVDSEQPCDGFDGHTGSPRELDKVALFLVGTKGGLPAAERIVSRGSLDGAETAAIPRR